MGKQAEDQGPRGGFVPGLTGARDEGRGEILSPFLVKSLDNSYTER